MAECTWGLLEQDWDSTTGWTDGDSNGGVSSISPAGQLYLNCKSLTSAGEAMRYKDIGSISDNYTSYIKFKGDTWDKKSNSWTGIALLINGGSYDCWVVIGNNHGSGGADGDGIWINNGDSWVKVVTKTWDNDWHTIRFDVHNSQTDVDVYVDDESSPSATDADCSYDTGWDNGLVYIYGLGSVAGNGEYHIDYIKINSGNCDPGGGAVRRYYAPGIWR